MSALTAVVALAGQASGAPVSSVGAEIELVAARDASSLARFERAERDEALNPDRQSPPEFGTGAIAPGDDAQPVMIPTPGTMALATLAGIVVILPRKRS